MRFYSYPYKEISINSAFLEIPAEYQRKLQMGKVKQMVAEFNGVIVNPPKVSYRDGRYIVIDGQHTIVGLKTLNGGNDLPILCRVYAWMPSPTLSWPPPRRRGCSWAPIMYGPTVRLSVSAPLSKSSGSTARTSTTRACGPLPKHGTVTPIPCGRASSRA